MIGFGWIVQDLVEQASKRELASELQTILDADVAALHTWLASHQAAARLAAGDSRLRTIVIDLVASRHSAERAELLACEHQAQLRALLTPLVQSYGYEGAGIVSLTGRVLADLYDQPVGERASPEFLEVLGRARRGEISISRPYLSTAPLVAHAEATPPEGRPTMVLGAPIRSDEGDVIAILGLRVPTTEFSRILSIARSGTTGETYAFDDHGTMLSRSRFPNVLVDAGLLATSAGGDSTLRVEIRDPGGPLSLRSLAAAAPGALPLTRMAGFGTRHLPGVDVDGYRGYRGEEVVGAWTWLDDFGFGVATEIETQEAFRSLRILQTAFGGLLGLLTTSVMVSLAVVAWARRAGSKVRELQALGPYQLQRKLGEGGMGEVHLARHALLRRPTAIKVLLPDKAAPTSVERFEREVRLTSLLTHPNTIAIYDYGRTSEGIFYYAMEYLRGFTLGALVQAHGALPEARVVHILRQVCESLREAHELGLVHRDIKPANVMLCDRGGRVDVVKLLDFGLVHEYRRRGKPTTSGSEAVAGTPAYMAPEAFDTPESVTPSSDLYSVGALAYFLLGGRPPFEASNVFRLFELHRTSIPARLADVRGAPVATDLERVVRACLAKKAEERPPNAAAVIAALDRADVSGSWTQSDAEAWWGLHGATLLGDDPRGEDPDASSTVLLVPHRRIAGQPGGDEVPPDG